LGWQTWATMPSLYWLKWGLVNFFPGWPWTNIFLISASLVARIIVVNQ
jgi:hypothetical protein